MAVDATYDVVILGAGIFGSYAALHFNKRQRHVLLVDSELRSWTKASVVNQARVHVGYHYPRSIATARLAHEHLKRFQAEHASFINTSFTHYYAIDRQGSLTDAQQFVRFCDFVGIPLRKVTPPDVLRRERLEAVFETTEHSFDPLLIRRHYTDKLQESAVELAFGSTVAEAEVDRGSWRLELLAADGARRTVEAGAVLNATYVNINAVNRVFGFGDIPVVHEISEIAMLKCPALTGMGLTVMDGPYVSIMPYGLSGLHSLSSVLYTHHAISLENDPTFDCQSLRPDCRPAAIRSCNSCPVRPPSNIRKILSQLSLFVKDSADYYPHGSLFTVKTKLKSSFVDDARPTDIRVLSSSPTYAVIFSGKINSIYEVERLDAP